YLALLISPVPWTGSLFSLAFLHLLIFGGRFLDGLLELEDPVQHANTREQTLRVLFGRRCKFVPVGKESIKSLSQLAQVRLRGGDLLAVFIIVHAVSSISSCGYAYGNRVTLFVGGFLIRCAPQNLSRFNPLQFHVASMSRLGAHKIALPLRPFTIPTRSHHFPAASLTCAYCQIANAFSRG